MGCDASFVEAFDYYSSLPYLGFLAISRIVGVCRTADIGWFLRPRCVTGFAAILLWDVWNYGNVVKRCGFEPDRDALLRRIFFTLEGRWGSIFA